MGVLKKLLQRADPFVEPYRKDRKTLRQSKAQADPDLDMSAAARAQRAGEQGFTEEMFHGTKGPWAEPEFKHSTDIGYHFGTRRAAEDRLKLVPRGADDRHMVGAFRVRAKEPLKLYDVGEFTPETVALQALISRDPFLKKATEGADGLDRDSVVKALKAAGYDSIEYINRVEGKGSRSIIALDPEQIRHVDAAFDPKRKHFRDFLASIAAAGGGGILANEINTEFENRPIDLKAYQ